MRHAFDHHDQHQQRGRRAGHPPTRCRRSRPLHAPVQVLNLPTILTLGRVAAIPALVAIYYSAMTSAAPLCCGIFVAASITDFLDGYLARKMNLVSQFGAFLDPVADKLMVSTALVLLCQRGPVSGPAAEMPWLITIPAILIIGREIAMSAFREWAASLGGDAHKAVAVSSLGKWKTATQMVALVLLLLCRDGGQGTLFELANVAGPVLLCISQHSWRFTHSGNTSVAQQRTCLLIRLRRDLSL